MEYAHARSRGTSLSRPRSCSIAMGRPKGKPWIQWTYPYLSLTIRFSQAEASDTWTPKDRWIPAQLMQITVPWLKDTQGSKSHGVSQSKPRAFEGWGPKKSTFWFMNVHDWYSMAWHLCAASGAEFRLKGTQLITIWPSLGKQCCTRNATVPSIHVILPTDATSQSHCKSSPLILAHNQWHVDDVPVKPPLNKCEKNMEHAGISARSDSKKRLSQLQLHPSNNRSSPAVPRWARPDFAIRRAMMDYCQNSPWLRTGVAQRRRDWSG